MLLHTLHHTTITPPDVTVHKPPTSQHSLSTAPARSYQEWLDLLATTIPDKGASWDAAWTSMAGAPDDLAAELLKRGLAILEALLALIQDQALHSVLAHQASNSPAGEGQQVGSLRGVCLAVLSPSAGAMVCSGWLLAGETVLTGADGCVRVPACTLTWCWSLVCHQCGQGSRYGTWGRWPKQQGGCEVLSCAFRRGPCVSSHSSEGPALRATPLLRGRSRSGLGDETLRCSGLCCAGSESCRHRARHATMDPLAQTCCSARAW